jgi:molecular chaperone GrpE (heat shock protein)
LTRIDQKLKDEIERKWEEIKKKKKELGQEKTKLEKRVSMAMAEERLKLTRNLEELTTQHTKNHEKLLTFPVANLLYLLRLKLIRDELNRL